MRNYLILLGFLTLISCKKEIEQSKLYNKEKKYSALDTITLSKTHKINRLNCDLDGDYRNETIEIVRSIKSGKSGLKIVFGNGKRVDFLGLGHKIAGQEFDEIDWVGIFEKVSKSSICWNNINEEGDILTESEIKECDKIKLANDGIFIHAEESCGGGIIYLKNENYEWIQQE